MNLLRLKAFFSRQWQQMPAAQFMAVFGPYSQRITQVLDRYDPAVLDQAARHVADDDERAPAATRGAHPMTAPLPVPASARAGRRSPAPTSAGRQDSRCPTGTRRPVFDDDLWDFTDVAGLPVEMPLSDRRFSFTPITGPRWRMVAKELIFAMLAPRHRGGRAAAAGLPHPGAPAHRLRPAGRDRPVPELAHRPGRRQPRRVGDHHCEAYLAHRRYVLDEHGTVVGERSPATRRAAAQAIIDLVNHGSCSPPTGRPRGLRPWGGASRLRDRRDAQRPGHEQDPARSAMTSCGRMLAAALYLTSTHRPARAST